MDKVYDLKLNTNQVDAILTGLGELPLKVSVEAFAAIRGQIAQQQAPTPANEETQPVPQLLTE
jgi:hypothetical protein